LQLKEQDVVYNSAISCQLQDINPEVWVTGEAPSADPISIRKINARVPHISLVFCEMWDSTAPTPRLLPVHQLFPPEPWFFSASPMQFISTTEETGAKSIKGMWHQALLTVLAVAEGVVERCAPR
jgi:hypothetical protein